MAPKKRSSRRIEAKVHDQNCDRQAETYASRLSKRMKTASSRSSNSNLSQNSINELKTHSTANGLCENKTEGNGVEKDHMFSFKSRDQEPRIPVFTPPAIKSQNIVHYIQQNMWGNKCNSNLVQSLSSPVVSQVSDMQLCRTASPFDRRVTAMEWHPIKTHLIAVGSKGGDIILWDTQQVNNDKFIQGVGPGGNIQAIKFWPQDCKKVVVAALDGRVTLHDLRGNSSVILADTHNFYEFWYCSVDVHADRNLVVAGNNTGQVQMLSNEGKKTFDFRLHKNKVTNVEFSPREEWLLCTSSTDQTVMFWDIRMLKDRKSALQVLKHERPVNSAYFSKTDGCRLLTTDQQNQVRVYQAPTWSLERTILHPHRFFQHITPIKATWHPLQDLAVVGRYPDPNFPGYHSGELRTIDIIDANTGATVSSLSDPSAPGIVCVNKFNKTGDMLASGMGLHILLWKQKEEVKKLQDAIMTTQKGNQVSTSNPPRQGSRRRNPTDVTKNKKFKADKTETKNLKLKLKQKNQQR